jgi:hypothetical protein
MGPHCFALILRCAQYDRWKIVIKSPGKRAKLHGRELLDPAIGDMLEPVSWL